VGSSKEAFVENVVRVPVYIRSPAVTYRYFIIIAYVLLLHWLEDDSVERSISWRVARFAGETVGWDRRVEGGTVSAGQMVMGTVMWRHRGLV